MPRDSNTLSNYNSWKTKHTIADLAIDFKKQQLTGTVTLQLESITDKESQEIILDTSFLDVQNVSLDGGKSTWQLKDRSEPYGSPLSVQDTPDVKSTYDFKIRSPLPVIASGLPTGAAKFEHGENGESGDIATASIGPRSVVSTGPEELLAAKWEFEDDTEKFIQVAEKLIFPYAWTQYNILVLPPSFPYGGMENPTWTYATPTVVSGDRENIDVIAHELSHSWSGNLVSNASWEHFWLNEGWTTYLERRIQAAVHGESHRDFSAIIGWKALEDSVKIFGEGHEFTKLVIDLKGKDPDDAFSSIPYEKGFHFLYYLEKLIGKSSWDTFIPHYFKTWLKKSLDSYDFKATLLDFFASDKEASKALESVDWDTWFYKPGMPPKPKFDTSMVDTCYALADKWESKDYTPSKSDIEGLSANQIVVFLEKVQLFKDPLTPAQSKAMGETYSLTNSRNVELSSRYLGIGLTANDESVYKPTTELLGKVGRMKFVRPLYRKLEKVDRKLALETFEKNKDFYHPICRGLVEKDLGL
ncbi:Leukotriene A-4 hydrolase-like protein [Lachnellula willkommii]|uniref:Leukotriene A-4 hydrolase-like protein n=1 Tax=Lachnellula willkommii TaxID=215461 RepID=A0A559MBR1_9HELO|nr:Leukotriene A-4 hydrolase-like protein [Lachnellula willkommii]